MRLKKYITMKEYISALFIMWAINNWQTALGLSGVTLVISDILYIIPNLIIFRGVKIK